MGSGRSFMALRRRLDESQIDWVVGDGGRDQ